MKLSLRVKKHSLLIATTLLLLFLLSNNPVSAQTEISAPSLGVDLSIVQADNAYSVPRRIVVIPLFPPSANDSLSDRDWYRGLYYFLTANTNRPGFTDIPFHYVVSKEGKVFAGNVGGMERKINIEGVGEDMIVVAYLAGSADNTFDVRAEEKLGEFLLQVANTNAIPVSRISVQTVNYVRDDSQKVVKLVKRDLFGLWQTGLKKITDRIAGRYKPSAKTYKISISEVKLTTAKVNPDDQVTGELVLKNTGNFGIYDETLAEIFGTKIQGTSRFYNQDSWVSNSQFELFKQGDILLPGEEKSFRFGVRAPLYFGQQTETFALRTAGGMTIEGTRFELKLDINRPAGVIVEVRPTQTGWLRVRSTPNGVQNNEIGRVSTGERYFQTEDAGNGWVRLKLSNGTQGWVSKQYLRYL